MSTAIVYFSLEGNTKYVAERIARALDADIIALKTARDYPKGRFSKYFWCGKSATFKERPKLAAYTFDSARYDLIILASPIWAGTYVPPLRTFFRDQRLRGKKIALVACCSGGPADKCFMQMENKLQECTVLARLRLVNPSRQTDPTDSQSIDEFCNKLKSSL